MNEKWGRLLAVGLGGVVGVVAPAQVDPALARHASPPTVESLVSVDGVRIDGTRDMGYDLGALQLGMVARFGFRMEHRLVTGVGRQTCSVWEFPELSGVVVPVGRDALRWRLFGYGDLLISAVPPGPRFYPIGNGFEMQRSAKGDFVFRNRLGWEWVYREWQLAVAYGPGGLQLDFRVQGGKVTEMIATRFRIAAGRLTASYDEAGRLLELRVGSRLNRFAYEGDSMRVSEWSSQAETNPTVTRFSYTDARVTAITVDAAEPEFIAWIPVPNGQRSDCLWPHAVGVGKTAGYRFKYAHGLRGYVLQAHTEKSGGSRDVTVNTNKGLAILAEDGAETKRVCFGAARGEPDAGRVTRIEDAEGNVVARYGYDAEGRVKSAWTKEDGTVEFSYGPDGTLARAAKPMSGAGQ